MHYEWSVKSRACFNTNSHRARYLKSDALMNPPSDPTPLYAIQVVYYPKREVWNISNSVTVV